MAKEALLQIKDAEDEVKKMLSSAQQENQEKINNAEVEGKNIYETEPGFDLMTTVGTSAGHVAVTEPETSDDKSVKGQTTPPYNPNN